MIQFDGPHIFQMGWFNHQLFKRLLIEIGGLFLKIFQVKKKRNLAPEVTNGQLFEAEHSRPGL